MLNIITAYLFDLEAAGRSGLTIISYRQHLKNLTRFLEGVGIDHVAQVSVNHLRAYLATCQQAGLKPGTIRARSTIISCFFNWCVEEGIIQENPMRRVRRPRKALAPRPIFTKRELLAIFAAAEHTRNPIRNKAMLCILIDCGLRASELMLLKREQYDPARSIFVVNGKGNKTRLVKLGIRCRAALEAHLRSTDGRLWDIELGGFRDMIYRLGKKAGVKTNPHKFRHTFANLLLDNGGTLDELSYLLGHSSISVTMIYAAAGQEQRALRSHALHSPADRLPAA